MIMATVVSVERDGVTVQIDGEEDATTKKYQSSVPTNPGDRVIIEEFGDTYQIMGRIRNIQSFDATIDDDPYIYLQLKAHRTYVIVETEWNRYQGTKTSVSQIETAVFATGRETDSPTMLSVAMTGSTSRFSTYSGCRLRYSNPRTFSHVAIIEL